MKRTLDETLNAVELMNGYDSSTRFNVADEVIITKGFYRGQKGRITAVTEYQGDCRYYLKLRDTEIYVGADEVRRF